MRALPNGAPISALGFGCSSIWAKPSFGDDAARAVFDACREAAINHFDTGPSYGDGTGETRLGQFASGEAGLVISTKVGTVVRDGRLVKDFTPDGMEASLGASLARLGREQVDILYLHGGTLLELNDETYRWFDREKARGRIVYSGINSFDPAVIAAAATTPLDAIMLQYSVADLSAEPLLDSLHGKIVIAATIVAQAVTSVRTFAPTSLPKVWYLARALRKDPLFLLRGAQLRQRLARYGLTTPADAVRLPLSDPRILSGVFGTSQPSHVAGNAAAAAREPLDYRAVIAALRPAAV